MSPPEEKTAADRRAEEEKMELERVEKLLDTSTDDISHDGKRRVDSLATSLMLRPRRQTVGIGVGQLRD